MSWSTHVTRVACLVVLTTPAAVTAQSRSLAQDSALNNLAHPPGTSVAAPGTLGRVRVVGTGGRPMLLIPGIGFGDDVWSEFMQHYGRDFTMYAVTLPGFGGTAPLAMPPDGAYATLPWARSSLRAIEQLMDSAGMQRVTVVAHWGLASQLALRLALDHPDRIAAVVLVSGVLKAYYEQTPGMLSWSPEQRARFADGMAQRWFRTVTRTTWDDNNYMAYDYAVNPRRGLFLWREAQAPSLAVWIRYLLEWYAMDPAPELPKLSVPTVVVQPGLDDPAFYEEPGLPYVRNLTIDSWRGAESSSPRLEFVRIPGARIFIMFDKPDELYRAIDAFLARHRK